MSTIHATSTPGGDWEINVIAQLTEPNKELLWSNCHLRDKCRELLGETSTEPFLKQQLFTPKCARDSEPNVQNSLGLQKTFWEAKAICCKEPQKTTVSFCPKTFTMAEGPKANPVGEKCEKELKELGDKCKEVMGEPSAEPFRKRKGSAPQGPWRTLVQKPWRKLGGTFRRTFLAAQDGSDPENQRHYETWRTVVERIWPREP